MAPPITTFLLTLLHTGARISELLAVTPERIDRTNGVIVFETLKRRRRGIFRAVPVETTAIFADVTGKEEQALAKRTWASLGRLPQRQ